MIFLANDDNKQHTTEARNSKECLKCYDNKYFSTLCKFFWALGEREKRRDEIHHRVWGGRGYNLTLLTVHICESCSQERSALYYHKNVAC